MVDREVLSKGERCSMFKDLNVNSALSRSSYGFIMTGTNQVWNVLKNMKEYFSQEFDRIEKKD